MTQAWIDASPEEQAALNQMAVLEDALVALVPDGASQWTVETVSGRPTVLVLVDGGLYSLSVEGGERSGAKSAEVRCRFGRAAATIQAVELTETDDQERRRRWIFQRAGATSLELRGVELERRRFARGGEDERTERFARALADAAGWALPTADVPPEKG